MEPSYAVELRKRLPLPRPPPTPRQQPEPREPRALQELAAAERRHWMIPRHDLLDDVLSVAPLRFLVNRAGTVAGSRAPSVACRAGPCYQVADRWLRARVSARARGTGYPEERAPCGPAWVGRYRGIRIGAPSRTMSSERGRQRRSDDGDT